MEVRGGEREGGERREGEGGVEVVIRQVPFTTLSSRLTDGCLPK